MLLIKYLSITLMKVVNWKMDFELLFYLASFAERNLSEQLIFSVFSYYQITDMLVRNQIGFLAVMFMGLAVMFMNV